MLAQRYLPFCKIQSNKQIEEVSLASHLNIKTGRVKERKKSIAIIVKRNGKRDRRRIIALKKELRRKKR
jgi:hypothetical protein